jgi:hypothetical protein
LAQQRERLLAKGVFDQRWVVQVFRACSLDTSTAIAFLTPT